MIAATLLLAGALGVHELRYLLAFGGDAQSAMAHHGHGYLLLVLPVLAAGSAVGFAAGLVRAAVAPGGVPASAVRMRRLWPAASAALLAIYVSQELVEGLLSPGHPGGWSGVFGSGGWIAVPLAIAFGAIVAVALRVARAVQAAQPLRIAVWSARAAIDIASIARFEAPRRSVAVLADHLAGRAPPLPSV